MKKICFAFFILLALTIASIPAHAAITTSQNDDAVKVFLLTGVEGVGQESTIPLGLDIKLATGWHTYWRSPGEAGFPPVIDWSKSIVGDGNLKSARLLYPAPTRYMAFGLETIGYKDHVLLPIDAELKTPGKPLTIDATLDLLVCNQICVPKHFILKLTVPAGPATPSGDAALIKQFRDRVPVNEEQAGLHITNVAVDGQNMIIDLAAKEPLQAPDLFIENNQDIPFTAPAVTLAPDRLSAKLTAKSAPLAEGTSLGGMTYNFVVVDGARALEQKVDVPPTAATSPPPPPPAAETAQTPATTTPDIPALPLGLVILFAVIGGFILNLMPCVLPVLSLKLLSVISHGGGEARVVRHSFLVTAAGIWFSFLALAIATISFKEAGIVIGWGVQFQQPVFLGFLILLLTFFAANMWGLYEIGLPRWLADNLGGPYHPKLASDFIAGAFATLLATPCSAPFLGTAVGFALAGGPQEILIVFAALGFGMSLPYLAVAAWPRIATILPRPGHWMISLRHLLGWALALTALWLTWVLAAQISERGAFVMGLCMLGILGLFGLQRIRPRSYINFGIFSFALLAFGITLSGSFSPKPNATIDSGWQMFDEATLVQDVAAGKTVFVDVTADWCITCKANKKLVLSSDVIQQRLFHSDIIPMQADWTNPNPLIASFLHKYGRYGIPFNAAFGPGAPQGIALHELLSEEAVLTALDKAEKVPQP